MSFDWIADKWCWRFCNGEREVFFSVAEIGFIVDAIERIGWRDCLDSEIDNNEENIVFDNLSREEFLEMCMEEVKNKIECEIFNPDYEKIVFDIAYDNGIWRD